MYNVIFDTYFTTYTCSMWLPLLSPEEIKQLILDSFSYLSQNSLVHIYGFVIMPNHLHVLWSVKDSNLTKVKHAFPSFTGHKIVEHMKNNKAGFLPFIESNQNDRNFHVWQRRSMWIPVGFESKFLQKLRYIHLNPVRKGYNLADNYENYQWSSAKSYLVDSPMFDFLTLWGRN